MSITFKGGIHPPEEKHFSEKSGIEILPPPSIVYVHMSQHLGAPAKPLVKKGDEVKMYQKIGESAGFISACVHSPVSGKVKAIEDVPHALGTYMQAIVIENDGLDTPSDELIPNANWEKLETVHIVNIIKEAGVVGMGGATFPTNVKLSPPKDKPVSTLIINGAECEPFLTADHKLMLARSKDILEGVKIMAKVLNAKTIYFAIEENKPDAIAEMTKAAAGTNIAVETLKTKYPQGAEKQLIYALTKKEVPSGGLPSDVGCCVQNVGTALAAFEAVVLGKPLVERITTISGSIVAKPKNFSVRIGTPISALLQAAGGLVADAGKIIFGGPMMGFAGWSLDVPIGKGTSGILFFPKEKASIGEETACILCAKCVDICPMRLMPTTIASYAQFRRAEDAKTMNVLDCIECGSCAFICPANRNLLHYIRWAKNEIRLAARK